MIQALVFATYAITLDGRTVLPRARAAVRQGHVLIPVRALGDALGADVGYDGPTRTITVQRGAHFATLAVPRDAIIKGTAYVPLREAANAFGLHVGYDATTRTVALDERRPPAQVVRVPTAVPPTARPYPPSYTVTLTPPPGGEVHDPYPAISARFAGAASIDPASLHLFLDGRDAGAEATVIGDQVILTPRTALSPGTHSVSISARDATGAPLERQWSFNDNFAFTIAPPPTPYPIAAIWLDRYVTPGTNAFDVYVHGVPGISGYIGVDGVSNYFPLRVYTANSYVAHVIVPNGVNQPFARVAARLTMPDGNLQTIVLPQTINLVTPPLKPFGPPVPAYPSPAPSPTHRSVDVPTPSPSPSPRKYPLRTPLPSPTPTTALQNKTPSPNATPSASPSPRPSRKPIIRHTAPPSPVPPS